MRHQIKVLAAAVAAMGLTACGETNVRDTSYGGSNVSEAARSACLRAVSDETGEGSVVVLNSEYSEANSVVMVGVGSQRAPWRCLVSNDGYVEEVYFAGSEGRL